MAENHNRYRATEKGSRKHRLRSGRRKTQVARATSPSKGESWKLIISMEGVRSAAEIRSNRQLYRDIVSGRVMLSEYNVLRRVCNALHYVKDILGKKGHKVVWGVE